MVNAIDLDDVYGYKTNAEMFMYIKEILDFDQLIWEFGDGQKPSLDSCVLCGRSGK